MKQPSSLFSNWAIALIAIGAGMVSYQCSRTAAEVSPVQTRSIIAEIRLSIEIQSR